MLSGLKKNNQIIIQLMSLSCVDQIKCLYAKLGTSMTDVDVTLSINDIQLEVRYINDIQLEHRNQILNLNVDETNASSEVP